MVKIHEISIRANHLSLTLHEILVHVLKYSISLHDACKTKSDLSVGLAEVIAANVQDFGKKKSIQNNDFHKKHFYDAGGNLKGSIEIEKLDVSVLLILLRTKFIFAPKSTNSLYIKHQCCSKCNHDKCFCGDKANPETSCKKKANCGYVNCTSNSCKFSVDWRCSIDCKHKEKSCSQGLNPAESLECSKSIISGKTTKCMKMGCVCCSSTKCGYIIVKRFVDVAAFFRNCISHITYDDCCDLEAGKPALEEFPLSTTWREVWDVVSKASLDCLKVLYNGGFIEIDDHKDYERRMMNSLLEKQNYLLNVVSDDIKKFYHVILGEEKHAEQMKGYKNELNNMKKCKNIFLNSLTHKDFKECLPFILSH